MDPKGVAFYEISSKKNFSKLDSITLAKKKSSLFSELSSKNETTIDIKMNKIFNSILKNYISIKIPQEKLDIIYKLIGQFRKQENFQIKDDELVSLNICHKISNKDYKMTFEFSPEILNEICTLITIGLTKLFIPKRRFATYNKLVSELQTYKKVHYDLLKFYKNYDSTKILFSKIPREEIPNEILILIEIFQGVKKIVIPIEEGSETNLLTYIILLANYDWLFPFVFEVELNYSNNKIYKEVQNLYFKKIKETYHRKKNNDSDSSDDEDYENIYNSNINIINNGMSERRLSEDADMLREDKFEESYFNILKTNQNIFDIILICAYFLKEKHYLKKLKINLPTGYTKEMKDIISLKNKNLTDKEKSDNFIVENVNFLEQISTLSSLYSINITFNSLEKETFENILYMIQNNSNLKELKLRLFPIDEKKINLSSLVKTYEENGYVPWGLKILTSAKDSVNYLINITSNNEKEIKQKLLSDFEINTQKLFYLLQTKKHLEQIGITITKPLILSYNEGMFLILLKFLFNVFIMLDNERFSLKELKLVMPYFNLDNKKYPIIGEFFNTINLNEKNKTLKNFYLQIPMSKILNINNLISYNLLSLRLGDLDKDTFKIFMKFYHSEDYLKKSQLKILNIELNRTVIRYKDIKKRIESLFKGKNPDNLFELSLKMYFNINPKELNELLTKANGNHVEKYGFIMKIPKERGADIDYGKFNDNNEFYFINKDLVKKINKYLPVIMKYGFNLEDKKNITKKIYRFLLTSNKKRISVSENNL